MNSIAANVIFLVGHGSLRIAPAGNRQGTLPPDDVNRMNALLEEAFEAAAAGFSKWIDVCSRVKRLSRRVRTAL